MIPTIEDIVAGLLAGSIPKETAIAWLNAHAGMGTSVGDEERRMFAAMAMQGICTVVCGPSDGPAIATRAVAIADALIARLAQSSALKDGHE